MGPCYLVLSLLEGRDKRDFGCSKYKELSKGIMGFERRRSVYEGRGLSLCALLASAGRCSSRAPCYEVLATRAIYRSKLSGPRGQPGTYFLEDLKTVLLPRYQLVVAIFLCTASCICRKESKEEGSKLNSYCLATEAEACEFFH